MSGADTMRNETGDAAGALAAALFAPMGSDGVYGRTRLYEDVLQRLTDFVTRERDPRAEVLRFPPVMSRQGANPSAVVDLLRSKGYRLFVARRKELLPLPGVPEGDARENVFCFHQDKLPA